MAQEPATSTGLMELLCGAKGCPGRLDTVFVQDGRLRLLMPMAIVSGDKKPPYKRSTGIASGEPGFTPQGFIDEAALIAKHTYNCRSRCGASYPIYDRDLIPVLVRAWSLGLKSVPMSELSARR